VHNRGGVRRLLDREHEAAVDLELVERRAAQIEQTRVASAEIIECEPHTERLQPQHADFRGLHVAEQHAFGELDLEPAWIEFGFWEDAVGRSLGENS